jgi:hypothetical protein
MEPFLERRGLKKDPARFIPKKAHADLGSFGKYWTGDLCCLVTKMEGRWKDLEERYERNETSFLLTKRLIEIEKSYQMRN